MGQIEGAAHQVKIDVAKPTVKKRGSNIDNNNYKRHININFYQRFFIISPEPREMEG